MKQVKVTVTAILTLSPGMEFIEDFVSEGEHLGPHLQAGDKVFRPFIEWMFSEPRSTLTPEERAIGLGHGYSSGDESGDESVDDWFFNGPVAPIISYTIERIEE